MNYDNWLERPYQDAWEAGERFVDWCEAHDFDPDDPNSERAYEEWLEDLAESAAEAAYERYMDAREYDYYERDYM